MIHQYSFHQYCCYIARNTAEDVDPQVVKHGLSSVHVFGTSAWDVPGSLLGVLKSPAASLQDTFYALDWDDGELDDAKDFKTFSKQRQRSSTCFFFFFLTCWSSCWIWFQPANLGCIYITSFDGGLANFLEVFDFRTYAADKVSLKMRQAI